MSNFSENKIYDCNIIKRSEYKNSVERTLHILAETLAKTLGPYGNNIAIEGIPESYFTKDGHTILSNIRFSGNIENMVLSMIKKISSRMNRSVGDGTTSSIVVSYFLFKELTNLMNSDSRINGRTLNNILTTMVEKVSERIKVLSFKPDNDGWIQKVATISANNNEEIGKLVAGAYKHYNNGITNIIVEQSSNEFYHSKLSSGYKLNYGLNSAVYINNNDKKVFNQSGDINVFMSEVPLTSESLQLLNAIVQQSKSQNYRTLVIIAPGYDNFVKSFFEVNKQRDNLLNYVCVELPSLNSNKKAQEDFEDLALITGSLPYNGKQKNFYYHEEFINKAGKETISFNPSHTEYTILGLIKGSVEINEYYTQFIGENPHQKEVIQEHIKKLEESLEGMTKSYSDDPNYDVSARNLKNKINNFKGNSTLTLYIGGTTDVERKTMTYLVQDAVYAVASALKFGLVPGQCATIIFILSEIEKKISNEIKLKVIQALKKAYLEYQEVVYKNFYGDREEIESHIEALNREAYNESLSQEKLDLLNDLKKILEEYDNPLGRVTCDLINGICYLKEFVGEEGKLLPISVGYKFDEAVNVPPAPNSAETDINIFSNAISIVNLLATCNGFLGRNALSSIYDF